MNLQMIMRTLIGVRTYMPIAVCRLNGSVSRWTTVLRDRNLIDIDRQKMIKAILAFIVLLFSSFLHAYNDLPDNIRATQVKEGCGIKFLRDEYPEESNGLSYPLYDVLMKWDCASGESALIDRYDIEGISPEIVTVLFWRKRSIAVLVKWAVNSHAADFQGDFYRVYVYRYEPSKSGAGFKKEKE